MTRRRAAFSPPARIGRGAVRRKSLRLKHYDYSLSGAYFVTIRTAGSRNLFGRIEGGRMVENRSARIVLRCWESLPDHYPGASLDAFVVMPDHVHGIVVLRNTDRANVGRDRGARAGLKPAPTGGDAPANPETRHGLPEVVRALKTFSARRINAARNTPGTAVWQRGYYERVIGGERELRLTQQYIESNPYRWQ